MRTGKRQRILARMAVRPGEDITTADERRATAAREVAHWEREAAFRQGVRKSVPRQFTHEDVEGDSIGFSQPSGSGDCIFIDISERSSGVEASVTLSPDQFIALLAKMREFVAEGLTKDN